MSIQVTPIPRLTVLTVPAFTLGTANAAGSASTAVASDSTLLAFDATVPSTNTYSASSAAGSAVVASRRDHVHGMPANPALVSNIVSGTRSTAAGGGDQTITGFGFDPTTVHFILQTNPRDENASYGWGDDDADGKNLAMIDPQDWNITNQIGMLDLGVDYMACDLDSYITDGIIITWVKAGAGADTIFSIIGMR